MSPPPPTTWLTTVAAFVTFPVHPAYNYPGISYALLKCLAGQETGPFMRPVILELLGMRKAELIYKYNFVWKKIEVIICRDKVFFFFHSEKFSGVDTIRVPLYYLPNNVLEILQQTAQQVAASGAPAPVVAVSTFTLFFLIISHWGRDSNVQIGTVC